MTSTPHRSVLQLAAGTVLVVDESVMRDGKLSEGGVGSLQALLDLVKEQVGCWGRLGRLGPAFGWLVDQLVGW